MYNLLRMCHQAPRRALASHLQVLCNFGSTAERQAESTFTLIKGLSRNSSEADVRSFLDAAFTKGGVDANACAHVIHPVVTPTLSPTGDWIIEFPPSAEQSAVRSFRGMKIPQFLGNRLVSANDITKKGATAYIEARNVKVSIPFGSALEGGKGRVEKEAIMRLDDRAVRVHGLPPHYGVDEVENFFRGYRMATPAVGKIKDFSSVQIPTKWGAGTILARFVSAPAYDYR
mmetsp:Transcript_56937/g.129011  ORF Transcript_56937/g.129011 Transcript_56937/m.129011 type:complete len:230 (+) Transcript_56937:80-769(+)